MALEKYRSKAAEMRRLAAEAKTPDVRDQYLQMAKGWEALAGEAEAVKSGAPPKRGRW